ncbi:hypothetical protein [Micromonospora globispora]|nr:hypothetical protein [Micromonospora globispora]
MPGLVAEALRGMLHTKSACSVAPDGVGMAYDVPALPSPSAGP